MESGTASSKGNDLLNMISELSGEIKAYRQRQLTAFREATIAMALLTWGAGELAGSQDVQSYVILRVIAAAGCVVAGITGILIIHFYRARIQYIRRNRNELAYQIYPMQYQHLQSPCENQEISPRHFYPVIPDEVAELKSQFKSKGTSGIYSWFLGLLAVLTVIANALLAWGAC